jgi:hypothetical protein
LKSWISVRIGLGILRVLIGVRIISVRIRLGLLQRGLGLLQRGLGLLQRGLGLLQRGLGLLNRARGLLQRGLGLLNRTANRNADKQIPRGCAEAWGSVFRKVNLDFGNGGDCSLQKAAAGIITDHNTVLGEPGKWEGQACKLLLRRTSQE